MSSPKARVLYTDIDGTLTWRGGLMLHESVGIFSALLRAREAGLDVVPVSGRGQTQVHEFTRLLGFPRGIGELGCLHFESGKAHWEFGDFPADTRFATPVQAMHDGGLLELVMAHGSLEEHTPWNQGRNASLLVRGEVDVTAAEGALAEAGAGWCQLVDNGLRKDGTHVYHLIPRGAGKAYGVRRDLERHGIPRDEVAYIGDSRADADCAPVVGQCWLVANADPSIDWPLRTAKSHANGVAELIDQLIS